MVDRQPAISANLQPPQIMKKVFDRWRPGFPDHVAAWVRELIG
jgi:hypothetical protein